MSVRSSYAVLPGQVWTNEELCERHGFSGGGEALTRMGGVRERRYWPATEPLEPLSRGAAEGCLGQLDSCSGVSQLIHCSTTPDSCSPAAAHRLHRTLALSSSAPCFDVASSCTSTLSALRIAQALGAHFPNFHSSAHWNAQENSGPAVTLIVAAEAKSRHVALGDARTASLFGDASVALAVVPTQQGKVEGNSNGEAEWVWLEPYVDSSLVDNIRVGPQSGLAWEGGQPHHLIMDNGRLMYRRTVSAFLTMLERAAERARAENLAVRRVFVHQANAHLLRDVKTHFSGVFLPVLMSDVGNLVSASLPVHRIRALLLEAIGRWWLGLPSGARGADFLEVSRNPRDVLDSLEHALMGTTGASGETQPSGAPGSKAPFRLSACYGSERVTLEDRSCSGVEGSWLTRMSGEEWEVFFRELSEFEERVARSGTTRACDFWIGAGGGFQALGALHVRAGACVPELLMPQAIGER